MDILILLGNIVFVAVSISIAGVLVYKIALGDMAIRSAVREIESIKVDTFIDAVFCGKNDRGIHFDTAARICYKNEFDGAGDYMVNDCVDEFFDVCTNESNIHKIYAASDMDIDNGIEIASAVFSKYCADVFSAFSKHAIREDGCEFEMPRFDVDLYGWSE